MEFNLLQTVLGPSMSQIDQEDKAQEEEEHGADQGKVGAPDLEKAVGDEKGQDH